VDFNLKHRFDPDKDLWQVTITGEIDIYNSAQLKENLNTLLTEKEADLYIDCDKLEYIDSTGLGALVSVLKRVKQFNGNIHLLHLKPNVAKLFKITDLNKVFVIEGADHE
jgi:anti-sigma B factor antagonist